MSASMALEPLGATIRAHIERGDKAAVRADDHYKAAGLHLSEAKAQLATADSDGPRFNEFLATCGIGRSRAYDS
jgi:ABC-type transporter Mla subunit MlaD